jgi:hypothetical protein
MDKRLLKRHKRQVARAKANVKISEPDVRTPEQIEAAREASGASEVRAKGMGIQPRANSFRGGHGPVTGSAAKTDAG